jgi:hypothetical protein
MASTRRVEPCAIESNRVAEGLFFVAIDNLLAAASLLNLTITLAFRGGRTCVN